MKNKSILFCTGIFPPDIGGPATYVLKMASRMKREGILCQIITYSDSLNVDSYDLEVNRIKRSFFLINYLRYFWKVILIGRKFDIIFLQGTFSEGIPTILANIFLRKKIIIRIGGIFSWEQSFGRNWTKDLVEDFLRNKQCWKSEILKSIDRWIISHCHKVIANSRYTKKLLLLNKTREDKITIIYNSIEPIRVGLIDKEAFKNKLGIKNRKIILSVGRFVPWKNFDKLITFFADLPQDYHLILIGDGPEKENLEKIIVQHNLGSYVTIFPQKTKAELYELYQVADIFVLISSFEGLSHVLIEAMQMKLPIISSSIPPNQEVLESYPFSQLIDINKKEFLEAVKKTGNYSDIDNSSISSCLNRYNFNHIYQSTLEKLCE